MKSYMWKTPYFFPLHQPCPRDSQSWNGIAMMMILWELKFQENTHLCIEPEKKGPVFEK